LRQCDEFGAGPEEERIARDHQRPHMAFDQTCKCSIEVLPAARLRNMHVEAERPRRRLHLACIGLMTPVVGIDQDTEHGGLGNKVMQDTDLLLQELLGEEGYAGNIPAGTVDVGDEAQFDWVTPDVEHDRDRRRCRFRRGCSGPTKGGNHCYPATSSAASDGTSPYCSVDRSSIATLRPSIWPSSLKPLRNAAVHLSPALLRKPTTGIAGCCARAASGDAAAATSSAIKSRRFIALTPGPIIMGSIAGQDRASQQKPPALVRSGS